ncbi:MAG: UvrD-helicase domain-containing protein [Candidatus Shapirobacteria bacterium]|nr:UvrD-helicase domain-containing protein [Candidatus Shapirobacteria bacterium]MDD3002402.1 UvrD-helicase domain-containing protein [Candidatus Shapirobacteria bacterium]MDD4383290.1 UvrD-helicase domain-containing protein [Candidatus Shapirobacteria bacterium]
MEDILEGLNPNQKEAVTHIGSPLLLLAGAGSGKTRVLTHRVVYFIQKKIAKPSEILLLTFTNKAAEEMKNRTQKLIPSVRANHDSPLQKNTIFAGTFHSFCCRVLRADGNNIGIPPKFVIYDSNDQENLIKNILHEIGLTTKEFKPSSVLYYIEAAKNSFQTPKDMIAQSHGFWQDYASKIYSRYQQKLFEFHALDFNDLLFKTVELFLQYPDVLAKYQDIYKFIMVDEYQDTNQIQYLLTKLLAQKYNQITVVGDASQAIYGWRGADYRNLVSFTTDFKNTKVINLEENYRSTQIILDAANTVISKNNSHPILKLFTQKKSEDKIKIFEAESEVAEADFVASKIKFINDNLKIPLRNIAVLYRMNAQSRVLEEAFLRQSIPYVLLGGIRFYERAEIKDILSMLRFASNSADHISEERIEKALGKRKKAVLMDHLKDMDLENLTSLQILESLVVNSGYLDKFDAKDEEDQKRIENIKELKSVAASYPNLSAFLENITLVQQEYSLQEKNKKKEKRDGVKLMTLHSAKGLEFEVVFMVGFEEGILPHSRCLINESEIEEERRLCYVGITRAKDYLYLSYASRRLFFGKSSLNEPSRFLSDIPSELVEFEESLETFRDYRHPRKSKDDDDIIYDPDIY